MLTRARPKLLRQVCIPMLCLLAACDLHGSPQGPAISATSRQPARAAVTPPAGQLDGKLQSMVDVAVADLLKRRDGELTQADIQTLVAQRVTWRTAALGCPQPDRGYMMVLTPGVRILLQAAGNHYEYHATPSGTPFLCEPPATIETPAPANNSSDPT